MREDRPPHPWTQDDAPVRRHMSPVRGMRYHVAATCHLEGVQNVLIGGLITLIGTILVQILIIPSVQRRTRKREGGSGTSRTFRP